MEDGFDGQVVLEIAVGRLPEGLRTGATRDSVEWARAAFADRGPTVPS